MYPLKFEYFDEKICFLKSFKNLKIETPIYNELVESLLVLDEEDEDCIFFKLPLDIGEKTLDLFINQLKTQENFNNYKIF